MSEFQHTNGTWVVKNGGMLGFGKTRDAAWSRAGAGSGGRVDDIFLAGHEWDALIQFIKDGHAD